MGAVDFAIAQIRRMPTLEFYQKFTTGIAKTNAFGSIIAFGVANANPDEVAEVRSALAALDIAPSAIASDYDLGVVVEEIYNRMVGH